VTCTGATTRSATAPGVSQDGVREVLLAAAEIERRLAGFQKVRAKEAQTTPSTPAAPAWKMDNVTAKQRAHPGLPEDGSGEERRVEALGATLINDELEMRNKSSGEGETLQQLREGVSIQGAGKVEENVAPLDQKDVAGCLLSWAFPDRIAVKSKGSDPISGIYKLGSGQVGCTHSVSLRISSVHFDIFLQRQTEEKARQPEIKLGATAQTHHTLHFDIFGQVPEQCTLIYACGQEPPCAAMMRSSTVLHVASSVWATFLDAPIPSAVRCD
jgi:hypothetical protein